MQSNKHDLQECKVLTLKGHTIALRFWLDAALALPEGQLLPTCKLYLGIYIETQNFITTLSKLSRMITNAVALPIAPHLYWNTKFLAVLSRLLLQQYINGGRHTAKPLAP